MSVESAHTVVLSLLQGFALSVDQKRVRTMWSAQRLLAFLALKDRPLTRAYVAGALWPETTITKANANLRSAVWRAQQLCRQLIDATVQQQLALTAQVTVDVHQANEHARRLLDASMPCDDLLTSTTRAELAADLLPDWYDDDWVLVEREQFHQLRLHALEAMCVRLTSVGRYGEAVDAGLAAVRAEPLRESAHLALVKAHLAAGNRWDAIRQYHECRRVLLDELGLQPSDALRDLLPVQPDRGSGHPARLPEVAGGQRSSMPIGAFRAT